MPPSQSRIGVLARSLGFSGSREGMSPRQLDTVERFLAMSGFKEAHHGDCVGADEQFHMLVDAKVQEGNDKIRIVIHPPDNPSERAFCLSGSMLPQQPYLKRNETIVKQSQVLLACPKSGKEDKSGTWHTINCARKLKHKIYIVLPDGTIKEEG